MRESVADGITLEEVEALLSMEKSLEILKKARRDITWAVNELLELDSVIKAGEQLVKGLRGFTSLVHAYVVTSGESTEGGDNDNEEEERGVETRPQETDSGTDN